MRAYEQKLYTRRNDAGDVAKQTKALHCLEHYDVNTEAAFIESGLSYSGRSAGNPLAVRESTKKETAIKA
jgi:hypothetical protein